MDIEKIISKLLKSKSIASIKDGTEFLTEDLKKEIIKKAFESLKTRIPTIIEMEVENELRSLEIKRRDHDEEYDFLNFDYNKEELLNGNRDHILYYISGDYKKYNENKLRDYPEVIFDCLQYNASILEEDILITLINQYYGKDWNVSLVNNWIFENKFISKEKKTELILQEYTRLRDIQNSDKKKKKSDSWNGCSSYGYYLDNEFPMLLREYCERVSLFLGTQNEEFLKYFVGKSGLLLDEFIYVPTFEIHSTNKKFVSCKNLINFINKNKIESSIFYNSKLKHDEEWLYFSIKDGQLKTLSEFINKKALKKLILKSEINAYRIKKSFEIIYEIYGDDEDLLSYFLSYRDNISSSYVDYTTYKYAPNWDFYEERLNGITEDTLVNLIKHKGLSQDKIKQIQEIIHE